MFESVDVAGGEAFPTKIADTRQNVGCPSAGFEVAIPQKFKAMPRLTDSGSWQRLLITDCRDSRVRRQGREQDVTSNPACTASCRLQCLSALDDGWMDEKTRNEKQVSHNPTIEAVVKEHQVRGT